MQKWEARNIFLFVILFKEVSLKPKVDDFIKKTKEIHENFVCLHGFMNLGERKLYNPSQEALNYINAYCAENNISLMDLFAKLDTVRAN